MLPYKDDNNIRCSPREIELRVYLLEKHLTGNGKESFLSLGRRCGKTHMVTQMYLSITHRVEIFAKEFTDMPIVHVPLHINDKDAIRASAARWRLEEGV